MQKTKKLLEKLKRRSNLNKILLNLPPSEKELKKSPKMKWEIIKGSSFKRFEKSYKKNLKKRKLTKKK